MVIFLQLKNKLKKQERGKCKNKQTETSIRVKREKLSYPVRLAEPNRKKKDAWQEVSQSKARSSFNYYRLPNFLFPSVKVLSGSGTLGTYTWLSTNADLKLPFSADSE